MTMAMSQAAQKKGLENSPRFKETMKFAKMQILTNELQRDIIATRGLGLPRN